MRRHASRPPYRRKAKQAAASPLPTLLAMAGLVAFALLVSSYARQVPFGQAPDESAHWQYVEHLANERSLPVFHPGGGYEFHQPPLYYALAAPFHGSLPLARLVNLVLGLLVCLFTYRLAAEYARDRPLLALGAAGVAAFLPMQVFLDATINNDVLLQACFAAALYLAVRGLRRGLDLPTTALMGVASGLGLLSKSSALMLLPICLLAILLGRERGTSWRRTLGLGGLYLAVALALGGWWLVRNWLHYGDPLALAIFNQAFAQCPHPQYFLSRGLSPFGYVELVAAWTWASCWGVFGNMNVFMPAPLYLGLGLLPLGALLGLARPVAAGQAWQRRAWAVMAAAAALLLASFVQFNMTYFQAQARYLLPGIPVYALLLALGWERLAPGTARTWAPLVPAGVLLAVAAWVAFAVIAPG